MALKQTWCMLVYNNLIIKIVSWTLLSLGSLFLTSCTKSYCYGFLHNRVSGYYNWTTSFCLIWGKLVGRRPDSQKTTLYSTHEQDSVNLVLFNPPFHIVDVATSNISTCLLLMMGPYIMWSYKNENAVYVEFSWACVKRSWSISHSPWV